MKKTLMYWTYRILTYLLETFVGFAPCTYKPPQTWQQHKQKHPITSIQFPVNNITYVNMRVEEGADLLSTNFDALQQLHFEQVAWHCSNCCCIVFVGDFVPLADNTTSVGTHSKIIGTAAIQSWRENIMTSGWQTCSPKLVMDHLKGS